MSGSANPFDRFDPPARAAASSGNPFDRFDDAPARESNTTARLATQAAAGANESLADLAGLPLDLVQGAMNLDRRLLNAAIRGYDYLRGNTEPSVQAPLVEGAVGSSDWIKARGADAARAVGVDPETYEPRSAGERIARGVGYGVGSAVAPGGAVMATERAGAVSARGAGAALNLIGRPDLVTASLGASGGAGASAAQEVAPDSLKPAAALVGGVAGGLAPIGAAVAGRGAVNRLMQGMPITDGAHRVIARNRLLDAASDPDAVLRATEQGADIRVPGVVPTTGEQTGDLGLLSLERSLRLQNPEPFAARGAQRAETLSRAVQGVGGDGQVGEAQRAAQAAEQAVEQAGQQRLTAAEQAARAREAAAQAEAQRTLAEARSQADQAATQVGGTGTPDQYGEQLRGALAQRDEAARQGVRDAYAAVPQDAPIPLDEVSQTARTILQEQGPFATPMSLTEQRILPRLAGLEGPVPFRDFQQLQQDVTAALAEELRSNGRTPAYARLSRLRGAIEGAADSAAGDAGGAAQALAQARQAARERAQTYGSGPVGEVLRPGARADEFRLAAERAPERFFHAGPTARSDLAALRQAVGDDEARGLLEDFAASQLRQAAGASGRLKQRVVDAWAFRHRLALEEFPALRDRLRTAAQAEDLVAQVEQRGQQQVRDATQQGLQELRAADAAGRAERRTFERSPLGRILQVGALEEVPLALGRILSSDSHVSVLRQLRQQLQGDATAMEGVRRGIADYLTQRALATAPAGVSDTRQVAQASFQRFFGDRERALRLFLTPQDVRTLRGVSEEIQRGQRIAAAATVSGSQTATNAIAALRDQGVGSSILARMAAVMSGGVWGLLSVEFTNALRTYGKGRITDLLSEAMLDPKLARVLMMEATEENQRRAATALRRWQRTRTEALSIGAGAERRRE